MACTWNAASRSFAIALLWFVSPAVFAQTTPLPGTYVGYVEGVTFSCGVDFDHGAAASFIAVGGNRRAGALTVTYGTTPVNGYAYALEGSVGATLPTGVAPIARGRWSASVVIDPLTVAAVDPNRSSLVGNVAGEFITLHGTGPMEHFRAGVGLIKKCPVSWTFQGQQASGPPPPPGTPPPGPPQPPSGPWVCTQGVEVKARGPAGAGASWRAVTPCAVGTTCFAAQGATSPDLLVRVLPLGGGRVGPAWMPLSASSFDVWSRRCGQNDDLRAWRIPTAPATTTRPGLLDLVGHAGQPVDTRSSANPGGEGLDDVTAAANPPAPSPTWLTTPALPGFRFQALLAGKPLVKTRSCPAKAICLATRPALAPDVVVRISAKQANGKRWAILGKFAKSTAAVWIEQTSSHALRYYELPERSTDSPLLPGQLDRLAFTP